MKKALFFHLVLLCLITSRAQFVEDFSDFDLSNNPTWAGDTNLFRINSNAMLQLYNLAPSSSNNSYIYTPSESIDNAIWRFETQLDFIPSSSNYTRIYLVSNTSNLAGNVNGYFVDIGRINKKIALCKQSGTTITELIASNNDVLNLAINKALIEVQRDENGNWTLAFDTSNTFTNLQMVGNTQDTTHRFTKFFGIHCRYSTTRAQHFFFDNFNVSGDSYVDTTSFFIKEIDVLNDTQIVVSFSKTPESILATNILNYQTNPNIGNITNAQVQSNPNLVKITFSNIIPLSTLFHLSTQNLTDIFGNALQNNNFPFYRIAKHDLIISEIMAHPNGNTELPTYRYLEVYNRLPFAIHLKNWKIHVGATSRTISEVNIPAQKYFIITDSAAMHLYPSVTSAYLQPFFSLSNNGATIRLRDNKNQVIDSISYTQTFFQDCIAAQGAFSLEKINLMDFCQQEYNWKASKHVRGGTPGFPNEVQSSTFAPLMVKKVEFLNDSSIFIEFSRNIDVASISIANFLIDNNNVHSLEQKSGKVWQINFQHIFEDNLIYNLAINNLQDSCHLVNPLNTSIPIVNYKAQENDIVINEILIRPTPSVGLPETAFIELKNRTPFPISLENWGIQINNSYYSLPFGVIEPDSFILIVRQKEAFQHTFENVNTLYTCSAINLSTSGARVSLFSKEGKLINSVNYLSSWQANNKQNGGWSLELTNADASCLGKKVWKSSRSELGGTPGRSNSWQENIETQVENYITNFGINNPDSIVLYLQQPIMAESCDSLDFTILPNQIFPQKIYYSAPELDKLYLKLPIQLQENTAYQLIIKETGKDCLGNKIAQDTLDLTLAKPIADSELLINEILFNPKQGGFDFVEIYNNSNHSIDLKNIYLGNFDSLLQEPTNQKLIHNESLYLLPQQYFTLTLHKDSVMGQYYTPNHRKGFWNLPTMPSFPNSEGSVSLSSINLKTFDQLHYSEKWHYKLLTDNKGASLERIFFNEPSNYSPNWHTAASTVGFATPSYQNSQMGNYTNFADNWVHLSSEYISPDLDGYQDFLEIFYSIPEAGYLGTFEIYTAEGILVKKICTNELLAQKGVFVWDGLNENGAKAQIGIHILVANFTQLHGKTHFIKKTFVVAGKF